ncbi:hypothetical protein KIPE111705_23300 [Kibdelosporangium persicum]
MTFLNHAAWACGTEMQTEARPLRVTPRGVVSAEP